MDTTPFEISCQENITSLSFEPDRACFLAGDSSGSLRQWSATDGVQVSRWTIKTGGHINAVVVSTDGRWIISGGKGNKVTIWSTVTRKREIEVTTEHTLDIRTLDISNDSTRFASVGSADDTVQIFDITSGVKLNSLGHNGNHVVGVKFSPDANRIATAAGDPSIYETIAIRVFNVSSGNKLSEVNTTIYIDRYTNAPVPLAWSSDGQRLLFASPTVVYEEAQVTYVDMATPLTTSSTSELWYRDMQANHNSYYNYGHQPSTKKVSIATSGEFIAYSGGHLVGFWEFSSSSPCKRIGQIIRHSTSTAINCIAVSHDGKHLACGHNSGVTVHSLEGFIPENYLSGGILYLPLTRVSATALKSWIRGNRTETEAILSDEIAQPSKRTHDAIAICALMRAHLREWKRALETAEMSLQFKPSLIGQIARVVALVGAGEQEVALNEYYSVFWDCESPASDVKLLVIINSILLFICSKREQAISHLRRFLDPDTCDDKTKDMYLQVLGMMYLKQGDYGNAIETLHLVQNPFTVEDRGPLMTIFIIFNWNLENLKLIAWQRACEKLYVTGSTKEVGETLLKMITTLHEPGEKELTHSHLLQEIINRSSDVTLLAWTGKSSACNSCLPNSPAVYNQTQLTIVPLEGDQLEERIVELRTVFPLVDALITHSSVARLQRVRFTRFRLHLPCIVFHVKNLRKDQENVYHAETVGLGDVEFTTSDVLNQPRKLVFVNPWIHRFRELRRATDEADQESEGELVSHAGGADIDAELVYEPMVEEVQAPTLANRASDPDDVHTRALELIAQLGQPFTALLLLKQPDGVYKRVGVDNEIVVRGVENDVLKSIPIEVLEIV